MVGIMSRRRKAMAIEMWDDPTLEIFPKHPVFSIVLYCDLVDFT